MAIVLCKNECPKCHSRNIENVSTLEPKQVITLKQDSNTDSNTPKKQKFVCLDCGYFVEYLY
jgi:hypothetical protein